MSLNIELCKKFKENQEKIKEKNIYKTGYLLFCYI